MNEPMEGKKDTVQVANYLSKIFALYTSGQITSGQHVIVAHDSWCAIYKHELCNCDPDIIVWPNPENN